MDNKTTANYKISIKRCFKLAFLFLIFLIIGFIFGLLDRFELIEDPNAMTVIRILDYVFLGIILIIVILFIIECIKVYKLGKIIKKDNNK